MDRERAAALRLVAEVQPERRRDQPRRLRRLARKVQDLRHAVVRVGFIGTGQQVLASTVIEHCPWRSADARPRIDREALSGNAGRSTQFGSIDVVNPSAFTLVMDLYRMKQYRGTFIDLSQI